MAPWRDSWRGWWSRYIKDQPKEDAAVRLRTVLLLVVVGAVLMILGNPGRPKEREALSEASLAAPLAAQAAGGYDDYIDRLERQVTLAVTQIAGVGNAVVMIVPETSEVQALAEEVTEREIKSVGGESEPQRSEWSVTRRPVVVTGEDGRRETPIVLHIEKPSIKGVLVVADGASDPATRLRILRAVATVLGIGPHRIEVVPKKM